MTALQAPSRQLRKLLVVLPRHLHGKLPAQRTSRTHKSGHQQSRCEKSFRSAIKKSSSILVRLSFAQETNPRWTSLLTRQHLHEQHSTEKSCQEGNANKSLAYMRVFVNIKCIGSNSGKVLTAIA
jgi:hypothetical protein